MCACPSPSGISSRYGRRCTLYGVHIGTPQLLATIMAAVGFRDVEISLVRKRGDRWTLDKRDGSKQGLEEYHLRARK